MSANQPNTANDLYGRPRLVAVSSCLLGHEVRYDGGHRQQDWIVGTLARLVQLVPICPEVEVGMGTPREKIHLLDDGGEALRLVGEASGRDWTDSMQQLANRYLEAAETEAWCGYVFKSRSPSCGLQGAHLVRGEESTRDGTGMFASRIIAARPDLPVVEELQLSDESLCLDFAERIFAYHWLSVLFRRRLSLGPLMSFHARHKFLLLAHSEKTYRKLGPLLGKAARFDEELGRNYRELFLNGMASSSSRGSRLNCLQHLAGMVDDDAKSLREFTAGYQTGELSFVDAAAAIHAAAVKNGPAYVADQSVLSLAARMRR